jgi:hypothetical protein
MQANSAHFYWRSTPTSSRWRNGAIVVYSTKGAGRCPEPFRQENGSGPLLFSCPAVLVVRAKPGFSGRVDRCVPIGEWRDGAYRVCQELVHAWGSLSVKGGFIQRSAVVPALNRSDQFLPPGQVGLFVGHESFLRKCNHCGGGQEGMARSFLGLPGGLFPRSFGLQPIQFRLGQPAQL